jgi:hypothetical protein
MLRGQNDQPPSPPQSMNPEDIPEVWRPQPTPYAEIADFGKVARTKKEQILSLFSTGIADIEELSDLTGSKPSYVATVLQESGHITGYFDLYTHTTNPMNIYSQFFAGKVGFKTEAIAQESVQTIDNYYRQFEDNQDRAGQHHALTVALTMFNRARWCGKKAEAEVYRKWLIDKIQPADEFH